MADLFKHGSPLKSSKHFIYDKFINKIAEKCKQYGEAILLESLGSFKNQKNMSYDISEKLLSVCFGEPSGKINVNLEKYNDNYIKTAVILFKRSYNDTSGELINIGSDGDVKISVNLSIMDLMSLSKESLFKTVAFIIAHELMHSNIFYNRYYNGQDIYDKPEEYNNSLDLKNDTEDDMIISGFAYALYNTYYQEIQAMVSQTNTEIQSLYNGKKIDNNTLTNAIKNCTAYKIYSNNLMVCSKLKNNEAKKKELLNYLNKYKININDIDNKINYIEEVSKKTIDRIYKNAMLYFEDGF